MQKLIVIIFFISTVLARNCPPGAVTAIDSGYGAPGPYSVIVDTLVRSRRTSKRIYAYVPYQAPAPLPLIVFLHGLRAEEPSYYEHVLTHVASKGYCVLFPACRMVSFPGQRRTCRKMYKRIVDGARMSDCLQPVAAFLLEISCPNDTISSALLHTLS